ncbi:hypothetical protein IF2G_09397 [Cordyceps javanica]|nr:hypothetical protein IF2G_09397 [Cordyceps javanica]
MFLGSGRDGGTKSPVDDGATQAVLGQRGGPTKNEPLSHSKRYGWRRGAHRRNGGASCFFFRRRGDTLILSKYRTREGTREKLSARYVDDSSLAGGDARGEKSYVSSYLGRLPIRGPCQSR